MRKVLVTGAEGFIGKNLRAHLQEIEDLEIFIYDIDNTEEQLIKYAKEADFIFHLAGVNRPKTTSEFDQGNHGLTAKLLAILKENKKRTPFLITSSTQALEDNPYGISKRKAEEEVFAYGKEAGASVYIYRLPNVFGKWSRPNYNSVVATFCYNIVRDLPYSLHLAVMGCVVNGPGEASRADLGLAGGKGEGLIFREGKILRREKEDQLLLAFTEELDKLIAEKYGATKPTQRLYKNTSDEKEV